MKCEACIQLLNDYIDGELIEIEHRGIQQHIDECDKCDQEARFLSCLSRDAALLPQNIQPDRDLWPAIEARILAEPISNDQVNITEGKVSAPKHNRSRTAAWGWRIAAAAVLCSLVFAGTYLGIRKQIARSSNPGISSDPVERQWSGPTQSPAIQPSQNAQETPLEYRPIIKDGHNPRELNSQPTDHILSYPLNGPTMVSVSNYGIYGLRTDLDASGELSRNCVIRFDRNGMQSWIPPLPAGSSAISLYPAGENRLYIAYSVQQPEYQTVIAEFDFAAESPIRIIWKSGDLNISRVIIGPQDSIYVAGVLSRFSKDVSKLTKGQSITADLVHIINPASGERRHLFPMTIRPRLDTQNWAGQTLLETVSLTPTIAVKSNGNFFLTIDRTQALTPDRSQIKNEAFEYSPDGTIARAWRLGTLEPNAYLNRIFVDVDDSILAEIVAYPNAGVAESINGTIAYRYLLRVDIDGSITRYESSIAPEEAIQGWMGKTRDLVTLVRGVSAKQPIIRIRRLLP